MVEIMVRIVSIERTERIQNENNGIKLAQPFSGDTPHATQTIEHSATGQAIAAINTNIKSSMHNTNKNNV